MLSTDIRVGEKHTNMVHSKKHETYVDGNFLSCAPRGLAGGYTSTSEPNPENQHRHLHRYDSLESNERHVYY
jgi:hypothetical protein